MLRSEHCWGVLLMVNENPEEVRRCNASDSESTCMASIVASDQGRGNGQADDRVKGERAAVIRIRRSLASLRRQLSKVPEKSYKFHLSDVVLGSKSFALPRHLVVPT